MGNQAIALGLLAASSTNEIGMFYGGYPITPASDILHYLANYKSYGVPGLKSLAKLAIEIKDINNNFDQQPIYVTEPITNLK